MTFRVGQKVCCIRSDGPMRVEIVPVLNEIYTIRDIVSLPTWTGIRLVEIRNEPRAYLGYGIIECTFKPEYFRPIVSRKTSIEIFTRMLTPQGVDA